MPYSDEQLIQKFKIKTSDRVLDVGGSMKQHPSLQIDTLVDLIRPEEAPYGRSKLLAKNFVRLDLTSERMPPQDKEFDFCLCTHTLEDLYNPFLAIEEMSRVSKRGLIITPSMGADMVFSHIDFSDWLTGAKRVPGNGHHKWFFYKKGKKMRIIPKNFPILYTSDFHITGWLGELEFEYYWEGRIDYEKGNDLNIHKLIDEYETYIKNNKSVIKRGRVLFYLDSPGHYLKQLFKLPLRRGSGFKHRQSFRI